MGIQTTCYVLIPSRELNITRFIKLIEICITQYKRQQKMYVALFSHP